MSEHMIDFNNVYNMDCLDGIRLLEDNSIDLVVTSPPYFNLRNYSGGEMEIGKESTVDDYINKLVEVFK